MNRLRQAKRPTITHRAPKPSSPQRVLVGGLSITTSLGRSWAAILRCGSFAETLSIGGTGLALLLLGQPNPAVQSGTSLISCGLPNITATVQFRQA